MGLLIFYISLALGVSFLCSVMEAVLLSISTSYVAKQEQNAPAFGKKLKTLKKDIDRPLAAILSLNTIAHTVGAAGAGAQAAAVFGDAFIGIISAVLTFLILVLSEIIPKTLGAAYWREIAPAIVRLLDITTICMWPLVVMSEFLTRLLTKNKQKNQVHRDEFIALAELGTREGIFHRYEARVLQNLFYLRKIRTRDIMTPRTVVFALPETATIGQTIAENPTLQFSRIPLYGENLDDIKGFLLKSDLLQAGQTSPDDALASLCRPIVVMEDQLTLHDLFERMMSDFVHIALVVDEYGGTEGIVTMEDFIETLLGLEIVDEQDTVEDMQEIARQQWKKRAKRVGLLLEESSFKSQEKEEQKKEQTDPTGDKNS